MLSTDYLVTGNAYADGAATGGWFVARFIDPIHGLRHRLGRQEGLAGAQGDFELKLFAHPAGHHEDKFFPFNRTATTLSILTGPGQFELFFCHNGQGQRVVLAADGDYALWAPGVGHRWVAHRGSTILTVRCPAVDRSDQSETPADQVPDGLLTDWHTVTAQTPEPQ